MKNSTTPIGAYLVWSAVLLLFFLHHDFWLWDNPALVFGFIPVGLFYHMLLSVAAATTWALAIRFAWPTRIEEWASANETDNNPQSH